MYHTEIHIKGKLNPNWSDWFDEFQVYVNANDETILYGNLPDKAAVYGILSRLSNLFIPLISVSCQEKTRI